MPTYIDRHALAVIPRAVQHRMQREALRGVVDEHGVQPLAHWVTDGVIYCVVRAPSQTAFCRHHAERGLACDERRRITRLRGRHPLSADEARIVRAALNRWPIDRPRRLARARQPRAPSSRPLAHHLQCADAILSRLSA